MLPPDHPVRVMQVFAVSEDEDEITDVTESVASAFVRLCVERKAHQVLFGDLLHGDWPANTTHLICHFQLGEGRWYAVPFSIDHPEDLFPFASLDVLSHPREAPAERVELIGAEGRRDMTEGFRPYTHGLFEPFFRPHAWSWLRAVDEDPDAELMLERVYQGQPQAALLKLRKPAACEWFDVL